MIGSLFFLSALAVGQEPARPPSGQERTELFAQWDRFEFPSTVGAPAVRVRYWGGEVLGFLLSEGPDGGRVLLTNLREVDGVEAGSESSDASSATYERVDLAEAVWAYLDDVRGDRSRQRDMFGLPARAQLVHLARICDRRGRGELVEPLLAEASSRREFLDRTHRRYSLSERVWGDLERTLRLRAWVELDDSEERREAFARFARRFPESRYAAEAESFVRVLERMIAEESSIAPEEGLAELEGVALVDALVARLRYARGHGPSINGGPATLFAAEVGEPPNGADRLVALGDLALPALVAACDDDTLTWIAYPGRADSDPTIRTVGDCAQEILARITGESRRPHGPAAWKTWWARRHADREVAAAIDAILAGAPDSPEVARALEETHAEDTVWAVELRVQESGEDSKDIEQRLPWIELYGAIDHPRVARFLAEQARARGRLAHRVAAALALERVDPAGGLAAARRLAEHLNEEGHTSPARGSLSRLVNAENDAARRLIEFLAERGAVDVLDAHYLRQWPHLRAMMAFAAAGSGWRDLDRPPAAATRHLLGTALGDAEPIVDPRQCAAVAGVVDPRVCDAAAFALARRSPRRFLFDGAADERARDEQIRAMASALGR